MQQQTDGTRYSQAAEQGWSLVLGPAAVSWEWRVERETSWTLGISRFEYQHPSKQREQSISVRLQSSASGRGEKSEINSVCFVDQIFVHPLNRIVWYKISVISTHTDTKTSVSARKRLISLLMLHSLHTQAPNCLEICVKPGS